MPHSTTTTYLHNSALQVVVLPIGTCTSYIVSLSPPIYIYIYMYTKKLFHTRSWYCSGAGPRRHVLRVCTHTREQVLRDYPPPPRPIPPIPEVRAVPAPASTPGQRFGARSYQYACFAHCATQTCDLARFAAANLAVGTFDTRLCFAFSMRCG